MKWKKFSGIITHKNWNSELKIANMSKYQTQTYSVNVTKSAGNCGFGQIYWKDPWWKTSFFVKWVLLGNLLYNTNCIKLFFLIFLQGGMILGGCDWTRCLKTFTQQ